jgi:hypothetical protein
MLDRVGWRSLIMKYPVASNGRCEPVGRNINAHRKRGPADKCPSGAPCRPLRLSEEGRIPCTRSRSSWFAPCVSLSACSTRAGPHDRRCRICRFQDRHRRDQPLLGAVVQVPDHPLTLFIGDDEHTAPGQRLLAATLLGRPGAPTQLGDGEAAGQQRKEGYAFREEAIQSVDGSDRK